MVVVGVGGYLGQRGIRVFLIFHHGGTTSKTTYAHDGCYFGVGDVTFFFLFLCPMSRLYAELTNDRIACCRLLLFFCILMACYIHVGIIPFPSDAVHSDFYCLGCRLRCLPSFATIISKTRAVSRPSSLAEGFFTRSLVNLKKGGTKFVLVGWSWTSQGTLLGRFSKRLNGHPGQTVAVTISFY